MSGVASVVQNILDQPDTEAVQTTTKKAVYTGSSARTINGFEIGGVLGKGGFSKVYAGFDKEKNKRVALKCMFHDPKTRSQTKQIDAEVAAMEKIKHKNVIRLYNYDKNAKFPEKDGSIKDTILVVLELATGGELFDYLMYTGKFDEKLTRSYFHQLVEGMDACHKVGVAHRDLKPENLLLDSNLNIKIADFGLSNLMRDGDFLRTSCGSPNYAAPEVISGHLYAGPEVDVWSCGVILYALLCGSLPFDDESIPNLFKKIKSGMYSLPSHLSQLARNLIPRMLEVDPMKRITIPEIRLHPWFQHKLPPYLRHPPEQMEKQERVIDSQVIDEVLKLPFHEAYQGLLNTNTSVANHHDSNSNPNPNQPQPSSFLTRELVEAAAALEDGRGNNAPKLIRDLRVAYELILDHKHTRLRVMEVARAIRDAAGETPPAFSPGGSRGSTPGSRSYALDAHGSYDRYVSPSNNSSAPSPPFGRRDNAPPASVNQGIALEVSKALTGHARTTPPLYAQRSSPGTPPVQLQYSIPGNVGMIAQHQQGRRNRRWYLGIQSKKDPAHVMTEVYKALMALGCEWLQLSSYRIKCRWRPNAPRRGTGVDVPNPSNQPPSSDQRRRSANSRRSPMDIHMIDSDQISSSAQGEGGPMDNAKWNRTAAPSSKLHVDESEMSIDDQGDPNSYAAGDDNNDSHSITSANSASSAVNMRVISGENGKYVSVPNLCTPEYSIKIGLTLYKVQQSIYLLDFQKMTGDAFSFMTLCANIITELKTLSAASKQQQAMMAQQQQQQQQQHHQQQQAAMHQQHQGAGGNAAGPTQEN